MSVFPKVFYSLPTKTYGGALRFLKGINPLLAQHQKLEKGIPKPGVDALKNTDDLYELIGRPLDVIPTIHVAGTNGKGSTSYKIAEGLKYSGLRTGLCTGPHISSFRERMQVNGDLVSEADVVNLLETVINLCAKHEIPATFFEIAFIMTCLHFQTMKCDVVVLEVGMGGRFDASNVINSHLSVVTSIGMDHMNSLGGTLESIAAHKAGIFKPHTAALMGPGCPFHIMTEEARKTSAVLHTLSDHLHSCCAAGLLPPLHSHPLLDLPSPSNSNNDCVSKSTDTAKVKEPFDPDLLCSQLALASLSLLQHYPHSLLGEKDATRHSLFANNINIQDPSLLDILLQSRLPCRFEELLLTKQVTSPVSSPSATASTSDLSPSTVHTNATRTVKVRVILDVAHNVPALSALMKKLNYNYNSNIRVVMGMSRGKGTQECLDIIKEYVSVDKIDFIQSDNKRAIAPEELYGAVGKSSGLKRSRDGSSNAFNMISGEVVASGYDALYDTLHAVLDQMASDAIASAGTDMSVQNSEWSCRSVSAKKDEGEERGNASSVAVCPDVLVVCGTLYAMPHVRRALGVLEPNDAFDVDVTI